MAQVAAGVGRRPRRVRAFSGEGLTETEIRGG